MRYQLFITVCSMAFISAPASAYDISYNDNPSGTVLEQPRNLAAPRNLPVARDGEIIDSVGSGATEAEMPITQKSPDGIVYITGGIGDEERDELKALESSYNTRVVLIAAQGEFMSELALRILDQSGKEVLRLENAGPILLANLPNGSYTVEAAASSGAVKSAKFTVPAKNPAVKTVLRFDE